jgi:hypothetical protein
MPNRLRSVAILLMFAFLLPPPSAFGWGDDGHMAINRVAARHVAKDMPKFFAQATDRLIYLGPEPDRWRHKSEFAVKNAQEPDHFIDLERTEGIDPLPRGRYEYYKALYAKRAAATQDADLYLPEKVGLQPYITMEIYDRLKIAFRDYRRIKAEHKSTKAVEQNIVFYAGWLGHYVADGSNPLHTTIQYNGWTGDNPNGYTTSKDTHWNFEGPFVRANLSKLDFSNEVKGPVKLENPFKDYVKYLWDSNAQVEKFYQLEKTGAFKDAGTPEGLAFTRDRLAAGAQMLANMWYTAWLESEKAAE